MELEAASKVATSKLICADLASFILVPVEAPRGATIREIRPELTDTLTKSPYAIP